MVWLRLAGIPFSDGMRGNGKKAVSRKKAAVKKTKRTGPDQRGNRRSK
jgi:hypothetical protein